MPFPIHQPRMLVMCAASMLSIFASVEALNRSINQAILNDVVKRTLAGFASHADESQLSTIGRNRVEMFSSGAIQYAIAIESFDDHPILATAYGRSPTVILKYLGLESLPIQLAVDYAKRPGA